MVVDRSSWHYRMWRWGRESYKSEPRDLCRYFWHIAIVKVILPLILLGLIVAGIVAIIVFAFREPLQFSAIVAGVGVGVGIIIGLYWILDRKELKKSRRQWSNEPESQPGIVRQYFKSRKEKYCPVIEVTGERK